MPDGLIRNILRRHEQAPRGDDSAAYLIARSVRRAARDALSCVPLEIEVEVGEMALDQIFDALGERDLICRFSESETLDDCDGFVAMSRGVRAYVLGALRREGCGVPNSAEQLARAPTGIDFALIGLFMEGLLKEICRDLPEGDGARTLLSSCQCGSGLGDKDVARDLLSAGHYSWLRLSILFAEDQPQDVITFARKSAVPRQSAEVESGLLTPHSLAARSGDIALRLSVNLRATVALGIVEQMSKGQVIPLEQSAHSPSVDMVSAGGAAVFSGVLGADERQRAVRIDRLGEALLSTRNGC